MTDAKRALELLPNGYAGGTSKLYGRGDFLPLDDPRGISEADFIGRLRALFGPVEKDEYVLRHRETGFVITAYAAQSGPSYGGGPRYPGELPPPGTMPPMQELFDRQQAANARVAADPELAKGPPVDWSQYDVQALAPEKIDALRQQEHTWRRRMADAAAPVGFAAVAAHLDALVSSVEPADWEALRYWSDPPTVYRVGIEDGEEIDDKLSPAEGIAYLIGEADACPPPAEDELGGSLFVEQRVLDYWIHRAKKKRAQVIDALPRVQAIWFRLVDRARQKGGRLGDLFLQTARERSAALEIDPRRAEEALSAPRP